MRLKGKVAIVTGASQGIGQAIALAFAREGAKVVLAARNRANLEGTARKVAALSKESLASLVVPTDQTDEAQVRTLVEKTLAEFGTVDILVNNSGVAGPTKPCEEVTKEEWEECMSVNVTGMFLCAKHVIPVMKKNRRGRIINVSSISGKRPLPNRIPYTASKMAVIGFTRTLAFELGGYGITVNAICPGATAGPRIQSVFENMARVQNISVEEAERAFTDPAALKCLVTPEDHAAVCVFLASDDAAHMTAQDINVTAGLVWY
ncbi:MAG: SDR family oxidoreductase [Candidatus Tectomicrobia bacterium]|uniref:SDR family oxidoreductase n=1 Tax=Tectimicrobiota bacterium TaxID=2528274 RepID=A0A932I1P8_UNCTE|nr:SDR family oxidoreductase [Candidatus Tectomicrobia bacterium]